MSPQKRATEDIRPLQTGCCKIQPCAKKQEWCTFCLMGNSLLSEIQHGGECYCFAMLLNSDQQDRESTWEGILCMPNKDVLAPYQDTNPGSTSIYFVPVSLTISHIYAPTAAAKCCRSTYETHTGNSRNSFIPCQNTMHCQLRRGIVTPRVGAIFYFKKCTRSQRQHRTWKQAGMYHGPVWQCTCPWETLSFSRTRGGNALSTPCNVSTGRGIDGTVELRRGGGNLCSELKNHSRCQYFPVFRHAASTFQASRQVFNNKSL